MEGWDTTTTPYFYDEPSAGMSSVLDPTDYRTRQCLPGNYLCKKEIEAENLKNFTQPSSSSIDYQFVELPQLESPSLPLVKEPKCRYEKVGGSNSKNKKVTTDWRDLDKFVASQLSQEDRCHESDSHGISSLLLQSQGGEEDDKDDNLLSNLLSSTSELCDIGICIFDK